MVRRLASGKPTDPVGIRVAQSRGERLRMSWLEGTSRGIASCGPLGRAGQGEVLPGEATACVRDDIPPLLCWQRSTERGKSIYFG